MVYCGEAKGKHTSEMIAHKVDEIIETLDLPEFMFKAITTDNAANMLKATKSARTIDVGLGCIDHTLQLVINTSIAKCPAVLIAVNSFKRLVNSTHKSNLANQKMRDQCAKMDESSHGPKVEFKQIISHCETRWNSMLMMARSVIHLEVPLLNIKEQVFKRKDREAWIDQIPEEEEFTLMKKVVRILTVFETVSTMMQSESKPTICHVISQLDYLHNSVVSFRSRVSETDPEAPAPRVGEKAQLRAKAGEEPQFQLLSLLKEAMITRFPRNGATDLIACYGNLLHPCFKGILLAQYDNVLQNTIAQFVLDNETNARTPPDDLNVAIDVEDLLDDEEQYFMSQINQLTGENAQASQSMLQAQTPLEAEIAIYRADSGTKFLRSSCDVLGWWSDNQQKYPLLAQAAKKYLAVQATSCAVERTFSTSGNTVTSKRTLLISKNVEMLVYVKENLPKVAMTGLIVENAEEAEMEADAKENPADESDYFLEF